MNLRILAICFCTLLMGCGSGDYLKIAGGGIVFNYRYSQAYMILIAEQRRPLPPGSTIQALFDVPDSSTRQLVQMSAMENKLTYKLETEPLMGFTKGGAYKITLTLISPDNKPI